MRRSLPERQTLQAEEAAKIASRLLLDVVSDANACSEVEEVPIGHDDNDEECAVDDADMKENSMNGDYPDD